MTLREVAPSRHSIVDRRSVYPSPAEISTQIESTKNLVNAAKGKLLFNRNVTTFHHISPDSTPVFYGYFLTDNEGFRLASIGDPGNNDRAHGLSIVFQTEFAGKPVNALEIMTAKDQSIVGEKEAISLWRYHPDQLDKIADMIRASHAVNKKEYDAFFQKQKEESELKPNIPEIIGKLAGATPLPIVQS